MSPAGTTGLGIITSGTATRTVLQHVAAIAAIAIARISITATQINHQQKLASCDDFEIASTVIDVVAAAAVACCGFLLHARLETLLSSFDDSSRHEITTNNDARAANRETIAPKPAAISSFPDDERAAYESLSPKRLGPAGPLMMMKQNRRGCDSTVMATDSDNGNAVVKEGDEGSILTRTAPDNSLKKRIALLRGKSKCNDSPPSNDDDDDAAGNARISTKLSDRLNVLESLMTPPPSARVLPVHRADHSDKTFHDDSAREYKLDEIEPALVVIDGSMPPSNPGDEAAMFDNSPSSSHSAGSSYPTLLGPASKPSRSSPSPQKDPKDIIVDAIRSLFRGSKAVTDDRILSPSSPGPSSSNSSLRTSRPLLNSRCGSFVATLDKNGFWQSLSNDRQQEAKSVNRPNIIEIMSVGGEDPVSQRILAKILVAGYGFGFCPVPSGEAALEELKGRYSEGGKESLPILILMDTVLPGMDGYETTKEIRSLFHDVALPIIMLTASSDLEITTFQNAVEAGANDLVTKPFNKHNLVARIGCQLKTLHFWRGQLESRQSEFLLSEILPKNIINKLKQGHTGCIYDELEEVSIIFTDIVSFTSLSASHPTQEIIHMLDSLFTEFDKLTDKYGLYKVETIGEKPFFFQVLSWYLLVPFFPDVTL